MGGEITWKCQSNGQYIFTLTLYRDCNGVPVPENDSLYIEVWNNPALTSIPTAFVSKRDLSPSCYSPALSISCPVSGSGGGAGAVQELIFQSQAISLSGSPPANGWVFTWDQCCRNNAVSNIQNPGSQGMTLRSIMYAYSPPGSGSSNNTNPCFDSSPTFRDHLATVVCAGFPNTFNHNAIDPDLDSLHYAFAPLLDEMTLIGWPASPLAHASGYTFSQPYPGTVQNPSNVPVTLNSSTGQLHLTNHTAGFFAACMKVESWRCGQKIAEVFREFQLVFLGSCGGFNFPPDVTFTGAGFSSNGNGVWTDTVMAGSLVQFTIQASDFDLNDTANPASFQNVSFEAYGVQFGDGFSNSQSGCLDPPCATLSPIPPAGQLYGSFTTFSWQTDCKHFNLVDSCSAAQNTYAFVIGFHDDFCPAPASAVATIFITVVPDTTATQISANGPTTFCTGDSVTLSVSNPSASLDYQWFNNGNLIAGASAPIITVNQAGIYWTLSSDSATDCSGSNYIEVHEVPPVVLTTISGATHVSPGSQYNYSSPAYQPGHTVTWNVVNGTIVQQINPSTIKVEWGNSGFGIVEVTHDNGYCSDSISLQVGFDLSLEEKHTGSILIFPNPSSSYFNFESQDLVQSIVICDALGKEVLNFSPNAQSFVVDLSELSSGIYFVRCTSARQSVVKRLILNRI